MLLFANTWEDSDIELSILKEYSPTKILMVCSGGDTLIDILCSDSIKKNSQIDVIDSSQIQISLCIFKVLVIDFLVTSNEIQDYNNILNGKCNNYDLLLYILYSKYKDLSYIHHLLFLRRPENIELLKRGILKNGQLELTFSELVKNEMDFQTCFNVQTLNEKFGSSATNLSHNFATKFKDIYNSYKDKYSANTFQNKFYHRMIHGQESKESKDAMCQKFPNINHLKNIRFIYQDMLPYITSIEKETYDFIQVSNITDWLSNIKNVKYFVKQCNRICQKTGKILWRSLNGNYDLLEICSKYSDQRQILEDKSYFYNLCFVTVKRSFLQEILVYVARTITLENISRYLYFLKLKQYMTLSEFFYSQIPFFFAVQHWVIALQQLKCRLLDKHEMEMADILNDNINDELGLPNGKKHVDTFKEFLLAISCKNESNEMKTTDNVTNFNKKIDEIIKTKTISYTCAYLGSIEYQYIFVSKLILEFVDKFHIKQEHYAMHEVLDSKHANDLFTIACYFNVNHAFNDDIYNGIKDGYQNFMQLYEQL